MICSQVPLGACVSPSSKGLMLIKDRTPDAKDLLKFLWKGEFALADVGVPVTSTGYAMCIYGTGGSVKSLSLPAEDLTCGRDGLGDCWVEKPNGKGFTYKDTATVDGGLAKVVLKPGQDGKALIRILAKGENLSSSLTLPDSLPVVEQTVIVQIVRDDDPGQCWQAEFPPPFDKNATDQLKVKIP